jgi:hypothetical protein
MEIGEQVKIRRIAEPQLAPAITAPVPVVVPEQVPVVVRR